MPWCLLSRFRRSVGADLSPLNIAHTEDELTPSRDQSYVSASHRLANHSLWSCRYTLVFGHMRSYLQRVMRAFLTGPASLIRSSSNPGINVRVEIRHYPSPSPGVRCLSPFETSVEIRHYPSSSPGVRCLSPIAASDVLAAGVPNRRACLRNLHSYIRPKPCTGLRYPHRRALDS
jgi:hypothetical protein